MEWRARFDAASRLTNLPREVKRTGRATRDLTSFRIFTENARGRAEGREAAKARARHTWAALKKRCSAIVDDHRQRVRQGAGVLSLKQHQSFTGQRQHSGLRALHK